MMTSDFKSGRSSIVKPQQIYIKEFSNNNEKKDVKSEIEYEDMEINSEN